MDSNKEKELRSYLESNVDIYLKPMLMDVLRNKPGDIHEFMCNWMKEKGL